MNKTILFICPKAKWVGETANGSWQIIQCGIIWVWCPDCRLTKECPLLVIVGFEDNFKSALQSNYKGINYMALRLIKTLPYAQLQIIQLRVTG